MNITNKEELISAVEAILGYLKNNEINIAQAAPVVEIEAQAAPVEPEPVVESIAEVEPVEIEPTESTLSTDIKALLNSDDWPEAAPAYLICKENEDDKMERADGIIEIISYDISNKKILDFGCGQGHLVKKMASQYLTSKVYGYDLKKDGILEWENEQGGLLTTNWEKIKQVGKFDIIILYDVLDHCENPVIELQKIRELCNPDTYVFCRCHPWTSPHALHAYQKINKAYIQLFLTEAELKELGIEPTFNQKTFFPIKDNADWFEKSNFYIENHKMAQIGVSNFFRNNPVIKERYPSCYNGQYPEWQMSQSFNDYVLKAK